MANKTTTPSLQDILRKRQQSDFVGRAQQVADFHANLRFDVTDERRKFIFSIAGQGGVGKTWLARRLRKIAEEFGAATALTDEAETDVPSAMGRIADQLEEQGHPLKAFSERYKVYRQRKQELEADPDAPQGLTAFVTRTVVDVGFDLLEHTPAGVVTKHLPREMLATQASEWAEFVRRKLANKDETRLVLEPIPVLTPLWLAGLAEIAQEHPLALFLDTYERTCPFLDPWLREALEGRYGIVPANIVWAISGRDALDDNDWAPYRGLVAAAALEPFSEEEAREYLGGKGITDAKIVEVILRLSGRLPLLVATLATQSPSDVEHIEDPADTAVERFLKWVDDHVQRNAALHAALPRRLNQDILACLVEPAQAETLFAWLQTMPFMQKRSYYWEYHEVVRSAMLRYLRTQSPKTWADLHRRLAEHYEAARDALGLDADAGRKDGVWQEFALEALYHRLCQGSKANLPTMISGFLAALDTQPGFARRWAETVAQAAMDARLKEVDEWGRRLAEGMISLEAGEYEQAIPFFTALVESPGIQDRWRAVALGHRGAINREIGRYDSAKTDFDQALKFHPNYPYALILRGEINRRKGNLEESLADFGGAIHLEPDNARAIADRAETNRLLRRYDESLADLNRAIALEPGYAWALAIRGVLFSELGRFDDALRDLSQAIEIQHDVAWALASRGETYRRMGRYHEALTDLEQFMRERPHKAWVLAKRGAVYDTLGDHVRALADLDQAIEIEGSFAPAFAQRGEILRRMGHFREALADFERSIDLGPKRHWSYFGRALTLRGMGREELALSDISCAIQIALRALKENAYDRRENFRLALYHLVAGDGDAAEQLYREALFKKPSQYHIREALLELTQTLTSTPKDAHIETIQSLLSAQLPTS